MSGFGGAKRDRTADLLHAMQALSQLSYGPDVAFQSCDWPSLGGKGDDWRPHGDSNPGRHRERVMS